MTTFPPMPKDGSSARRSEANGGVLAEREIENGFSSGSLLAMSSVAVCGPGVTGAQVTVKVVEAPGASTAAPGALTENCAGVPAGPLEMERPVRSALPVLRMVKVRVAVEP